MLLRQKLEESRHREQQHLRISIVQVGPDQEIRADHFQTVGNTQPFANLTPEVPLRQRQVQGVIVAEGWTSVPPECHDESLVTVELLLRDERRNELCFEFGVRVDRSVKRKYERRQRERHERMRSTKGGGRYGPAGGQFGDQKSVSPEEAINLRDPSGEGDRELHKPH